MGDNKGRPNWGKGFGNLSDYLVELINEKKKHKSKLDEIEASLMADLKVKQQEAETTRKDTELKERNKFLGKIFDVWKSPDASPELKQAMANMASTPDLIDAWMTGKPVSMGGPTRSPSPEEALLGQPGGRPPQKPDLQYLMGTDVTKELFKPVPKERQYGFTKPEFEEKARFTAGLKEPSVAERKLKLSAQQVAAALERGNKLTKDSLGRVVSIPFGTTKEDFDKASIEMGWAPGTPEYDKHIVPAKERWWNKYQTEEMKTFKTSPRVRKEARKKIREENKRRRKSGETELDIEDNIDHFIEKYPELFRHLIIRKK